MTDHALSEVAQAAKEAFDAAVAHSGVCLDAYNAAAHAAAVAESEFQRACCKANNAHAAYLAATGTPEGPRPLVAAMAAVDAEEAAYHATKVTP